jgi:hypothetical protein
MRLTPARTTRLLNRLLGVWLVVLITLPFTAPFQTFELGAPSSEAAIDVSPAKDVTLAASSAFVPASPSLVARFDVVRRFSGRSDYYRLLPTVLRV